MERKLKVSVAVALLFYLQGRISTKLFTHALITQLKEENALWVYVVVPEVAINIRLCR